MRIVILVMISGYGCLVGRAANAVDQPETPRIDSVVMPHPQPEKSDPATSAETSDAFQQYRRLVRW